MKFQPLPFVIDAIQWTGRMDCLDEFNIPELQQTLGSQSVEIHTPAEVMTADVGDWVIKDAKGGFYLCKPDVFAYTHEPLKERL
jgi:hypothetical protein